jgi:hypothetical protein
MWRHSGYGTSSAQRSLHRASDEEPEEFGLPHSVFVNSYMSSYTGATSKRRPGTSLGATADLQTWINQASQEPNER